MLFLNLKPSKTSVEIDIGYSAIEVPFIYEMKLKEIEKSNF